MEEKWRGVNYNKGFKNVKELLIGTTFGIPNGAIVIIYMAYCFIFAIRNNL
jgi:hypothetical protein